MAKATAGLVGGYVAARENPTRAVRRQSRYRRVASADNRRKTSLSPASDSVAMGVLRERHLHGFFCFTLVRPSGNVRDGEIYFRIDKNGLSAYATYDPACVFVGGISGRAPEHVCGQQPALSADIRQRRLVDKDQERTNLRAWAPLWRRCDRNRETHLSATIGQCEIARSRILLYG